LLDSASAEQLRYVSGQQSQLPTIAECGDEFAVAVEQPARVYRREVGCRTGCPTNMIRLRRA
jgi:hypothetical protein